MFLNATVTGGVCNTDGGAGAALLPGRRLWSGDTERRRSGSDARAALSREDQLMRGAARNPPASPIINQQAEWPRPTAYGTIALTLPNYASVVARWRDTPSFDSTAENFEPFGGSDLSAVTRATRAR